MLNLKAQFWIAADRALLPRLAESLLVQNGWCILLGHGVCADSVSLFDHYPLHIHASVFRQQMEFMLERGYRFISLDEGLQRLKKGQPLNKMATLTFDDGFRNVLQYAYPVMSRLDLKGCLYAIASLVGTERVLWTDMVDIVCMNASEPIFQFETTRSRLQFQLNGIASRREAARQIKRELRSVPDSVRREQFKQIEDRFLAIPPDRALTEDNWFASWEELKSLDPNVLEIGNHSLSHPNLAQVDSESGLREEVFSSKEILESHLGRPVKHFCYPGGSYDSRVISFVRDAGHESSATVRYGLNRTGASQFELARLGLPSTLAHFKARISGFEAAVLRWRGYKN